MRFVGTPSWHMDVDDYPATNGDAAQLERASYRDPTNRNWLKSLASKSSKSETTRRIFHGPTILEQKTFSSQRMVILWLINVLCV